MAGSNAPIQAIQHVRRMRGGSQAHLFRASDNHFYVVKFQNNPQSTRILANEFFGTLLGRLLGLPMPEVQIIEVSEWLIANTPELKIDLGGISVPCTSGLQFGSRYVTDPLKQAVFDYLPHSMLDRISNLNDFPRVLAFDKWTNNNDGRQAVFVKQPHSCLYSAFFIDQGYCFNAGEWNFQDSPLRGIYGHNAVYAAVEGWDSFEPALSRIEQIALPDLLNLSTEIPREWYRNDRNALSDLLRTMHKRRTLVREFISAFRNSSRKPFPNWTV
jgi:hypothetical protein